MSLIDLNNLLPVGIDGARTFLPKQQEFFSTALDPKGPSHIAYFGGYGSGKSLILCITLMSMGILYGGEYLIAREFMPELRRTTMKLFLELVPKGLLLEHRVADAEIHLRAANGKKAVFYFVGLESPEKLDSLNLDGGGIDEASQTTEEAFLKLQGRLRGTNGLRKLLLVGNPKGHDWVYRRFIKQDHFKPHKGKYGKIITVEEQKANYCMIIAPSTENKHLPDGYIENMLSSYSAERIKRDVYGSFDSFQGQVYSEFDRSVHVIRPFRVPGEWNRVIGIDHGFSNPAAWIYGAIDHDDNIYIYREFYKSETLIKDICEENVKMISPDEMKGLQGAFIDPSVKGRRGQGGASDWDYYIDNLPRSFPLLPAKNDVEPGIDKVKSYLRIHPKTHKPKLFIFDTCVNLIDEMVQYQYDELAPSQEGKKNLKETPKKYKDHAVDALRYLLTSRPDSPKRADAKKAALQQATLESSVLREWDEIRNPQPVDPFGDF